MFTDLAPSFTGAKPNFLVLTVPPIWRAPLFENQGGDTPRQVEDATRMFNDGLKTTVIPALQSLGGYVGLYDTAPVFNVSRVRAFVGDRSLTRPRSDHS